MAIYHLSAKTVNRSSGRTAVAAAAYRARESLTDTRTRERHNYTAKADHRSTVMLLPKGVPGWMKNKQLLWNMAEVAETRKNANTAREIEIALPSELSKKEQNRLVIEFTKKHFVSQGMIAQVSIHEGAEQNPHAHVMLTTRLYDPETHNFGIKGPGWDKKQTLRYWREQWAIEHNETLARNGFDKSHFIDHRTLKAQGISRPAQIHQGPEVTAMMKRGIETDIGKHNAHCKEIEKRQKLQDWHRSQSQTLGW